MKELHVAAVAVKRGGVYFMQRRVGDSNIGAANLIGFFGGKIEQQEIAEQAARRELGEETDLLFSDYPLEEADRVTVMSDYKNKPAKIYMTIFDFDLPEGMNFRAKEGELIAMNKKEILARLDEFTPGTRAFFEKYKGDNNYA